MTVASGEDRVEVSLGEVRACVRQWEDRAAAELAVPGLTRIGGGPDGDGGCFWTVRLETLGDPRATCTLGVAGAAGPAGPSLLGRLWGGRVWLGAGRAVYAVDPWTVDVVEHGFESMVVEFAVPGPAGVLVVACETGLRGYGPDGSERWRRDTDLIVDLRWSLRTVTVEQMDAPPLTLLVDTGAAPG